MEGSSSIMRMRRDAGLAERGSDGGDEISLMRP
jgi:hypothetical protein